MGNMERREFIGKAGLAGILATGWAPAARAGQSIRWRLASRFPKAFDLHHAGVQTFIQTVKELSGGKFDITFYNLEDLPPSVGVFESVQKGSIECGHTSAALYPDKDEVFAFDAGIPFGLNPRQMQAWLHDGNGLNLLREAYRAHGVVNFPLGSSGARMGGWFRNPIRSVADFRKLRMRTSGLAAQVLKRMGAVTSQLPGGDLYRVLEQGGLDAAEWGSPYDDLKLGLDRIARYCAYPGWGGKGQMTLLVHQRAYDALTNENKAIVEAAAAQTHAEILSRYDTHNAVALREMVAAGARLTPFPEPVLQALHKTAHDLYAELGDKNPRWKKIHASHSQFIRDQAWAWGYGESALAGFLHRQTLDRAVPAHGTKNRR